MSENTDYNAGYFDGKDFARRSTPRLVSRWELEDMALAFSEKFDYDYEEAQAILSRAYVCVFEGYKDASGFVCKVALVCYETGLRYFDHYEWTGGQCGIIERA